MAETPKFPTITEIPEEPTTGAGSLAPASEIPQEPEIQEPEPTTEQVVEPVAETIEEPIVPEPVETEVIEPVIETPAPVVAEEPIKTADTKVETVQDIKSKETSNEAQENELNETKKNQVVSEMQKMIQNGSTLEEIAAYGTKNIQFKDDINTVLRGSFKNLANAKYFGKYSTLNNEDMYAAYQTGAVVPGSQQYNLLPAEKKASFDAYLAEKRASNLSSKTDFTSSEKTIDLSELESQKPKMYSSTAREQYEKALNNPRISELSNKLTQNQVAIDDIDDAMNDLFESVEDSAGPGALVSQLASRYKEDYKDLADQKRLLLRERTLDLGEYQTLKSNAETELEIAMYEDSIAREQYQTELSLYETRRKEALSRGEKLEDREFTLKTQQQAEARQKAFTIEMKELDQRLKAENKSGTYQTDRDGNLLYVVNGKATQVKNTDGTVVGVTQKKGEYSESIQKNTDGTYSIFRTYEDGRKPEMFNYGINGDSSYNTQMGVYDAIGGIDSKPGKYFNGEIGKLQCGEAVNRYLKTAGIADMRVGDSYESKKAIINNNVPQVGGLAVWNPNSQGEFGEYGHIGIVTGYNPDKGEVEITDWNKEGNGEKNTYTIPVSQVLNSDGGFTHLESESQTSGFDENKTPLYAKFNAGKMSQTQELKYADDEEFLNQALAYGQEKAKPGFQKIEDLITLAESLKGLGPIDRKLPDNAVDVNKILGRAGMNELIDLKSQGATFGSLTEKEFERIQSSVLNVGNLTSADKWNSILDDYITTLRRGLPDDFEPTQEEVKQTSSINSLSDEFNSYNNSAAGVANTQADYSSTLGF